MYTRKFALLIALLLCVFTAFSQDSASAARQMPNGNLKGTIQTTDSTVTTVKSMSQLGNTEAAPSVIDTEAIQQFKLNAKVIYANYIFGNGYKPSGWEWLRFYVAMGLILIILGGGLYGCFYTALCKDASYLPDGTLRAWNERTYSYARVQLLWWSQIVLCLYVYFYGVIGELLPPNVTMAGLLGLGSVVYAAGRIIDNRQIANTNAGHRSQDQPHDDKKDNIIKDILSDNEGLSIHRFQSAVFNVVFGVGYISFFVSAFHTAKYPLIDFSDWQFALLGISSATYLGLKTTENDHAEATNAAAKLEKTVPPANTTATGSVTPVEPA